MIFAFVFLFCKASIGTFVDEISKCLISNENERPSSTNIKDLKPEDISLIMAIGDSMTSGFGSKVNNLIDVQLVQECRGASFSIGGDSNIKTLVHLFRHFNSKLKGYSRGCSISQLCDNHFCPVTSISEFQKNGDLNVAFSGATSSNLDMQHKSLIKNLIKNGLNYHNEWKFLTIFIGLGDLCIHSCKQNNVKALGSVEYFEDKLINVLINLKQKMPKTIVAIILLPDISQLVNVGKRYKRCQKVQELTKMQCPCAFENDNNRWNLRKSTFEFNNRILKVVDKMKEHDGGYSDFAVIALPFLQEFKFTNKVNDHYLSKFDCYHPSIIMQEAMAKSMWNSLFIPFEQRQKNLTDDDFYCPGEMDRIIIT